MPNCAHIVTLYLINAFLSKYTESRVCKVFVTFCVRNLEFFGGRGVCAESRKTRKRPLPRIALLSYGLFFAINVHEGVFSASSVYSAHSAIPNPDPQNPTIECLCIFHESSLSGNSIFARHHMRVWHAN